MYAFQTSFLNLRESFEGEPLSGDVEIGTVDSGDSGCSVTIALIFSAALVLLARAVRFHDMLAKVLSVVLLSSRLLHDCQLSDCLYTDVPHHE